MLRFIYTLCFTCLCSSSFAQFGFTSTVPKVEEAGYYNLQLSPEVIALSKKADLSDIRIKDGKGNEVPYVLRSENPKDEKRDFTTFDLEENSFKDSVNVVIVKNEVQEDLSQFCITLKSADIRKQIGLRASNDMKTWFVVKQNTMSAMSLSSSDQTEETIIYDFPKGNYKYYQLTISNQQKEPLQIINVGKYKYTETMGKYIKIDLGKFVHKDSAKVSYITFPDLKFNYKIDLLEFVIESKFGYQRDASIAESRGKSAFKYFTLSSKNNAPISLRNASLSDKTEIRIENKDNPPLSISSVVAYQWCRYICVYLEKGTEYTLYGGDNRLSKPEYDLTYFEENIPKELPLINTGEVKVANAPQVIPKELAWYEKPLFMWLAIALVGGFLFFVCYRMIGDLNKKK